VIIVNLFLPINTPVVVEVEAGNLCQNEHDRRQEKQDENTEDGIYWQPFIHTHFLHW